MRSVGVSFLILETKNKMKCSVITPEHCPENARTYLVELFQSLQDQTYTEWEWVIGVNGKCLLQDIPFQIRQHPQVRVHALENRTSNIGEIKNLVFGVGTGDILVEVDHDDYLVPECLEKLVQIYEKNPDVGFVYSDDAVLGDFKPYPSEFGWTSKKYKQMDSMNSFEPTSHSLAFIWYAPDHVRSWRKSIYNAVKGHDPSVNVCDDHDLMIRTYLKTKMHRIPEVLYVYRVTGNNTWLQRNADIQTTTVQLFQQHARALAERDADLRKLLKVDLGGGIDPLRGYMVIDQHGPADITCNLDDGIPLPDNSVGVLNASHILEHLKDPVKSMREIHRVLAHGGWAFIEVPSTEGRGAWQDPTHVSYWNENSFLYYTDKAFGRYIRNTTIKFQAFRLETHYPSPWWENMKIPVVTAWLVAHKDDSKRLPHVLKI